MTSSKTTKRALLGSVVAMLVCFTMLLSTTFAWFTDTAVSASNKIIAGNLDVVLEYKNDWSESWKPVDETTKIFKEGALYEPGYTEVVYLRVSNAGSLALKYNLMVNVTNEKGSINVEGDPFKLSENLQIGTYVQDEYSSGFNYADILIPTMFGTREAALSNVGTLTKLSEASSVIKSDAPVLAGDETAQVVAIVLTMPEAVGNEANYDATKATAPTLDLGVTLVATQLNSEKDTFGSDYDKDSEYPVINTVDTWDGTADTSWYSANPTAAEFTLSTAEQLAAFAKLVDEGVTFEGKTVKLGNDIDLRVVDDNGELVSFDPIGYGYNVVFKGTFDGQGHTISNLYQNGWALGLDYSTEGGGLFASVVDATIKNLTIDKAEIVMECIDMGAVVGYSYGNCTYENITVKDSTIANYNRYTGGVVGEVNGTQTFKNVDVIDTTVSALWGTYDAALGGIVGGKWGGADLTFEDCDVSAKLDAFNDACSNYQYYNYRLCGMLIGMSEEVTDGTATASYLTCKNCTVTYGDWANYTYCEFEANGRGSYAAPDEWKFSRVQEGYATGGVDANHTHDTDESHEELLVFDQLFGGDKGVRGGKTHEGVTVVYNNK